MILSNSDDDSKSASTPKTLSDPFRKRAPRAILVCIIASAKATLEEHLENFCFSKLEGYTTKSYAESPRMKGGRSNLATILGCFERQVLSRIVSESRQNRLL